MSTPVRPAGMPNAPVIARELSYRLERERDRSRQAEERSKLRFTDLTLDRSSSSSDNEKTEAPKTNEKSARRSKENDTPRPLSSYSSTAQTLAGSTTTPPRIVPTKQAWSLYFTQEVAMNNMLSGQMYVLTFATGVLDITTYKAFGVFATKMTGNLLLLALDALEHDSTKTTLEYNVITALTCFIIGAVCFGHIGRLVGRRRRLYLLVINIIQTALVFGATAIEQWGIPGENGVHAIIRVSFLAFAMAGQVSLAIGVGLPELNTTMITAALIQLCYDPRIFCLNNRPRTKRLAFILTMAAGHFAGGFASKGGFAVGILVTACVKAAVTLSFLFNPGVVPPKADEESSGTTPQRTGTITPAVQVLWGD